MCQFMCAIIPRVLFILASLVSIGMVTEVKGDPYYWLLAIPSMLLLVEMIITLKIRKGRDYKWFSPPIFLFLISIIPSFWILELDKHYKATSVQCKMLPSSENVSEVIDQKFFFLRSDITFEKLKKFNQEISRSCSNEWILLLYEILLLLLIVGRWLLPLGGGITREELSELLLIFVGTAADIHEFSSETLSDVKENGPWLVHIVLSVWTWSMLQFPLHVAVAKSKPANEGEQEAGEVSLLTEYRTDIWSIVTALSIQDGPFLVVRLTVMIYCNVFHHMLVFFAFKNFLVITLNLYRLVVICQDSRRRAGRGSAVPCV